MRNNKINILLANPFGIGDVLFTTPVIANIKAGLKEKGLNRAGEFQWDAAAQKTLDIFCECVA